MWIYSQQHLAKRGRTVSVLMGKMVTVEDTFGIVNGHFTVETQHFVPSETDALLDPG